MNNIHLGFKAIMFDLGGVLIDLHYEKTAHQLAEKAGILIEEIGDLLVTSDVLKRFEVGDISDQEFRLEVCRILNIQMGEEEFDSIWNALLGEISQRRIQSIRKLKCRTLILSNTNSIHERAFNKILHTAHGISDLHNLVDKVYFSHEIRMRKPNIEIYKYVLKDQGLNPAEILFIDDREDNIEAAKNIGLQVFLNKQIDNWMQLPVFNI